MLKTHFLKRQLKNRQFTSAIQSSFHTELPDDRLVTTEEIVEIFRYSKESPFKSESAVLSMLRSMVEQEFVYEFYGMKIEKALGIKQ